MSKGANQASLMNVMLLTVLALVATGSAVNAGFSLLAPHLSAGSVMVQPNGAVGFGGLVLAEAVYLLFAGWLVARDRKAQVRKYALALQLQSLVELLFMLATVLVVEVGFYFLVGLLGDTETQASLRGTAASERLVLVLFAVGLALPGVTMLVGAWRLHALSRTPHALPAAADGSLLTRTQVLAADAEDARRVLERSVARLTDRSMPGLGRLFYSGQPSLRTIQADGAPVHELSWANCPMKLIISMRSLDDGRQEVTVRCVLRDLYRLQLFATPLDALAQMQYIEAHLLEPLRTQLATASAERQRDALRDQAVESQLRILQAQIEPHFLFNTLANVRHLYRSDTAAGEEMLDHLIAYLRYAMDDLRAQESTIGKEMDLAAHYLSIMQIRMGERLSTSFVVPDTLIGHGFPPAMLISLVENAIKHGLSTAPRGEITLRATVEGSQVRLTVLDNGSGMSSVGGTGVGLSNIRQRLEAMYGSRAWLEVGVPQEGGFAATIVIPLQERN